MCCLVAIAALIGPRVAFFTWWIFGDQVSRAFEGSFWLPLFAVLIAPWTSLAWVVAWAPVGGVRGVGFFVVALGILADLATYTGGMRNRAAYA